MRYEKSARARRTPGPTISAILLFIFLQVCLVLAPAIADSALRDRLTALDDEILTHPSSSGLLLARAGLYLSSPAAATWPDSRERARADLEAAALIAPPTAASELLWSQWWLADGETELALETATRALELAEDSKQALFHVRLAAVAAQMGRHGLAADHRMAALAEQQGSAASPELYLLTIDSLVLARRESSALDLLEHAISDLGAIGSLVHRREELLKERALQPDAKSQHPAFRP